MILLSSLECWEAHIRLWSAPTWDSRPSALARVLQSFLYKCEAKGVRFETLARLGSLHCDLDRAGLHLGPRIRAFRSCRAGLLELRTGNALRGPDGMKSFHDTIALLKEEQMR